MRLTTRTALALLLLSVMGCHPKPPVTSATTAVTAAPQPPPSPPTTEAAIHRFSLGDFEGAALEFVEYLTLVPTGGERDEALFYLGLLYALPGEPGQDWQRSANYFDQLSTEFPESHLKLVAQLILSLRDETTKLSAEVTQLNAQAAELRNRAQELERNSNGLYEELKMVQNREEVLKQEAAKKEERIKQLNADLERLIRIDSESRPRRQ